MNTEDWWKYSDSFLKVVMNTGQTREVSREDVNSVLLDSLGQWWDAGCAGALPFAGDYGIDINWDAGFASFVITKATSPLAWGYFSSQYDDQYELAWGCVQHHYFALTDKSAMAWSLPSKPASKPFLALIRCEGDLRCDCDMCQQRAQKEPDAPLEHARAWLAELESALGFLLLKEGFPKEFYEDT